jgi:hypothetical protein
MINEFLETGNKVLAVTSALNLYGKEPTAS